MNNTSSLILGSGSAGRLMLLESAGYKIDKIISAEIDETPLKKEKPREYVKRIALNKLECLSPKIEQSIVITADTTSVCRGKMLHKTYDDDKIREYFTSLSGSRHRVYSGVCCAAIQQGKIIAQRVKVVESIVQFRRLSKQEIEFYINNGEGRGKSGGCSIQGIASRYIKFIRGSFSNIIGLPMCEVSVMLESLGYKG